MAPIRKVPKGGSSKASKPTSSKSKGTSASNKSRISKKPKAPPPKQQKTKSASGPVKKKRRVYTEKELGLMKLNMITPVGVEKPKGKKKGKIFVDDQESMMTILAIVNADKEGQIEGKMMKSRQMEEIREARRKEAEARQDQRKTKLEDTKESLRRKRKRRPDGGDSNTLVLPDPSSSSRASKKRVSFA